MKLNLGCGGQIADGWVNLDRMPGPVDSEFPYVPIVHDLREPLPFADDEAECAVLHHVLDLLSWPEILALLTECRRVCTGAVRVSSFDPRLAVEAVWHSDTAYWTETAARGDTYAEKLTWQLALGTARKTALTPELLHVAFANAGFGWITQSGYRVTGWPDRTIVDLDSRPIESFYMEAW